LDAAIQGDRRPGAGQVIHAAAAKPVPMRFGLVIAGPA
jgi:hypothetical protein